MKFTIILTCVATVTVGVGFWYIGRERRWLRAQRAKVILYLDGEGVQHRGVGGQPVWFVSPYISVWEVESQATAGVVGWWAISGDFPTDYVSGNDAHDPRSVLAHFARHWSEISAAMLRGEAHPEVTIGTPDEWPHLGDLLQRRSQILAQFAEDENVWN